MEEQVRETLESWNDLEDFEQLVIVNEIEQRIRETTADWNDLTDYDELVQIMANLVQNIVDDEIYKALKV